MNSYFKKFVVASVVIIASMQTAAITKNVARYKPDDRSQIPAAFDHSYVGFGAGYTDIPFSNRHLINGFQATHFTNPTLGLNVFIGHYFNPHLAFEISLMRPVKWSYAHNINSTNDKHSIWSSLFGLTLKPTLLLSDQFDIYGVGGLGIVSRHGFQINNLSVIPSTNLLTFLTGFGITYAITSHWHLNLGLEYAVARPSEHEPHMLYSYASFYYLFTQLHLPEYYTSRTLFPKNLIQIGGFSTKVFHPNVNKYFTVGYLPIFWTGDLKTKNGEWIQYERNIFHTHKSFAFDLGASVSTYHSKINNTSFQAFSVYPSIRYWFCRSPFLDFYFTYSVAGPTLLTKRVIDGIDLGGHFTFQDLLGFGFSLGKEKHLNLALKIGHYSNGNLWPNNPGVEVPLVASVGYAFE